MESRSRNVLVPRMRGDDDLNGAAPCTTSETDLPDGQISRRVVKSLLKKYSVFPKPQITAISFPIPSHSEGRCANVNSAGRVAMAVEGAFDWGA